MTKYITPISTGFSKEGIKNDCVIRAITNATGRTYEEVEAWALKHTDYKINGDRCWCSRCSHNL